MALSLPSQSVSKSTTVASAMPGIFCAVGNAKVYCFCVVCGESHSLAQQGWCLPYHAHIYVYPLACYSLQRASSHEVLVRVQGFGVQCWLQGGEQHLSRCDLRNACKAILRLSLPRIYCTVTFHNTFWLFIHTMACALQEKPPPCFPHAHFPY